MLENTSDAGLISRHAYYWERRSRSFLPSSTCHSAREKSRKINSAVDGFIVGISHTFDGFLAKLSLEIKNLYRSMLESAIGGELTFDFAEPRGDFGVIIVSPRGREYKFRSFHSRRARARTLRICARRSEDFTTPTKSTAPGDVWARTRRFVSFVFIPSCPGIMDIAK